LVQFPRRYAAFASEPGSTDPLCPAFALLLPYTSATSTTTSAIAAEVFTAGGVDHTGATVDTLVFPAGTITLTHSKGTSTQTFNPKTR